MHVKDQKYTGTTIFKSSFLWTQMKAELSAAPVKTLRLPVFLFTVSCNFSMQCRAAEHREKGCVRNTFLETLNLALGTYSSASKY